jgi:taurine dehydrogenase large subunit
MTRNETAATPAALPYDPRYDPLREATPGENRAYAPTYWIATAGAPPADDGPLTGDGEAEVVVVGSGYTGLATAIFLAREHGIKAHVVEANRVAWGCSTRNGGQGQSASGRLSRSQWIARWGVETAKALHQEIVEGFEVFSDLVAGIDCDPQSGGHLHIAHRPRYFDKLKAEAEVATRVFGYGIKIIGPEELRRDFTGEKGAAGATLEPLGTGIHAGKLAFGYLKLARSLGAKVHPGSPVTSITREGDFFRVVTPKGSLKAKSVVLATGGYGGQKLHPALKSRIMPILSNSVVTRVLSKAEIEAAGIRTRRVMTDTRTLRFYYRLLPDDRLQIGSRSAIAGADAENPKHLALLERGIAEKFPALAGVALDYSWWGWVDVSHDMMPRIVQPDGGERLFYAGGYGGNGVSYSAQAGRRVAALVAGQPPRALPIFQGPLPGHAFAPFRRIGQSLLYRWYQARDEAA